MAYATARNVLGHKLYDGPSDEAWLAPEACSSLEKAACLAASYGLCLVLLDAYRPAHAQQTLWERFMDERFVAKPVEENGRILSGSAHTRGIAVDCALASAFPASGRPEFLPMPSAYDDFSPAAMLVNAKGHALANAKTLKTIMRCAGFEANPNEWWHFELPCADAYPFIPQNEQLK